MSINKNKLIEYCEDDIDFLDRVTDDLESLSWDYLKDAPLSDVVEALDIADRISEYSYVYFGNVYLEEDEDMSTFFTAYRVHYGKEPVTVQKFDDEQRIRTYGNYRKR